MTDERARVADDLSVVHGSGADLSIVDPHADGDDRLIDAALRPKSLAEFVGQERVREQLSLILDGAKQRVDGPVLRALDRVGEGEERAVEHERAVDGEKGGGHMWRLVTSS